MYFNDGCSVYMCSFVFFYHWCIVLSALFFSYSKNYWDAIGILEGRNAINCKAQGIMSSFTRPVGVSNLQQADGSHISGVRCFEQRSFSQLVVTHPSTYHARLSFTFYSCSMWFKPLQVKLHTAPLSDCILYIFK